MGSVFFHVTEHGKRDPMPCRIHLASGSGEPVKAPGLPFFRDHFSCPGEISLSLPADTYQYTVERGPEYESVTGAFRLEAENTQVVDIGLRRLINLPSRGWYAGDLHVHRPVEHMEMLMRAEDLHIAPVITWWNKRNLWEGKEIPGDLLAQFDGNRYYHLMAGEDERGGGAFMYFGAKQPMAIQAAEGEWPPQLEFVKQGAKDIRLWVDIEKPFWWDVAAALAQGHCRSIGICNNHMCRSSMYPSEAWGKPRDAERLPPPRGVGFWSQEIYYHALNTGLRIPPSAGSASGVLPNPVGYNRVYVLVDGPLTWEKWWRGLGAGRSFVTNGPLLLTRVDGQPPGHVFKARSGKALTLRIDVELVSRDPIETIELVKNGAIERAVPYTEWLETGNLGDITFTGSGWFLVRAVVKREDIFRFASTAPYYVEIGRARQRVSKASAQFFLDWARERAGRLTLEDPQKQKDAIAYQRQAIAYWEQKVRTANAD